MATRSRAFVKTMEGFATPKPWRRRVQRLGDYTLEHPNPDEISGYDIVQAS
ncbi:MAG: hypothetical protein WAV41_00700 [Microgenomates group bacterium]